MKPTLLLLIFSFFQIISAQNLVKNPSFENSNKGPWTYGEFVNNVHYWSSSNSGTPDYFSANSRKMNTTNYRGYQEPKTGDDYTGIYTYTTKDDKTYREYIQGELFSTLKKDKTYTITFYLSLAENSSHSINEMHLLFS